MIIAAWFLVIGGFVAGIVLAALDSVVKIRRLNSEISYLQGQVGKKPRYTI